MSKMTGRSPASINSRATYDPMKPAPPVMRVVIGLFFLVAFRSCPGNVDDKPDYAFQNGFWQKPAG
jgi:hypothetical protein